MKGTSAKQQQILDFVGSYTDENGYPPTVREIAAAVGLRSPSTVHSHIKKLIEQGYLDKAGRKTRTVSVKGSNTPITRVPILGRVTAGMPILAVEDVEGYIPIDMSSSRGEHFALRIQGSSMIGAGIYDGDYIIVRKQDHAEEGEIVVALIGEEATCKRLTKQDGHVVLMPENPAYPPIDGDEGYILGVVVMLYRKYPS